MKAVIFSLAGTTLSDEERELFRQSNPLGFILFGRNIESPEQLTALCDDLQSLFPRDVPILIDQEGGRVQRMREPYWPQYPAMRTLCDDEETLKGTLASLSKDLAEVGINVNCAPVLDVLCSDTHDAIGDRAFSDHPERVALCGKVACEAMLDYGITPVIKHLPGQGRARSDSHKDLPRVSASNDDLAADFYPFQQIVNESFADQLWGMVAHIVYEAIDPDYPSSASSRVIDLIRDDIGFDGLLLSDDLDMDALAVLGDIPQRAKSVLEAGCDIALYCWGQLEIMKELADALPDMRSDSVERYERSKHRRHPRNLFRHPAA